ncbi:MAG: LysR family transcriptional regulator [Pseudomonas marincola]
MSNISKITLTQWAIFNAVIDNSGYLNASKALNRSHSSLHHAVAKLQDQLGVHLITVQGKSLHLTEIGTVLYRRSQQLLKDAADLEKLAALLNDGWESEITLAVENIYPKSMIPNILKKFEASNKITRLQILDIVLAGAVEVIDTAAADIVISPIIPAGHVGTPLTTVALFPIAHKDHPLLKTGFPVNQKELANELQLVIRDTAKSSQFPSLGWLRSERRWTVSDFYHAKEIMKSGQGFCWGPTHFFDSELETGELCKIPTTGDYSRVATLYLVVPKPEHTGPGVELLIKLIKEESNLGLPPS